MPSRPPTLRAKPKGYRQPSGFSRRQSRQERGYGRAHDLMRAQVLTEEPLCYVGLALDPPECHASTIADHKTPKTEGGTDERENYGGICHPCHVTKTAREAARARRRNAG